MKYLFRFQLIILTGILFTLAGRTVATATLPAPGNIASVQQGSNLKISWDSLSDPNLTGYAVYRSTDGVTFTRLATVPSTAATYSDNTFNPATPVYYRVTAMDASGTEGVPSVMTGIAYNSMQVSTFRPVAAGKAVVGDFNGDGKPDIALAGGSVCTKNGKNKVCVGKVDIYFGGHYNGRRGTPDLTIAGETLGFGHAMVAVDMNKDGYAELVVSDPLVPQQGIPEGGKVYIYLGGPSISTSPTVTINGDISYASGGYYYTFYAEKFGESMAVVGDFSGSGYPQVAVGAPRGGMDHSGSIKILSGGINLGNYIKINGLMRDDLMGTTLAAAGDVNGDGYPDIVAGAPNDLQINAKKSYLILGGPQYRFAESLPAGLANFPAAITGLDSNGDRFSDMVLGQYAPYDTSAIIAASIFPGGVSPVAAGRSLGSEIPITSLGDMDKDGHEELLVNGPKVIFGTANPKDYSFMSCPTAFTVIGTGDTDGDGVMDIIGTDNVNTYICSPQSFKGLPEIVVDSPATDDVKTMLPRITLAGRIKGSISTLFVGGRELLPLPDGSFQTAIPLVEGANIIEIIARATDGRIAKKGMTVTYVLPPPLTVAIELPANNSVLHANPVVVSGSVSDPAARVTVNGIAATVVGTTFSISLALPEGANTLTAQADDQYSRQAASTVTITLATTGTVAGMVNDASSGVVLPGTTVSVTAGTSTTAATTDIQGRYSALGIMPGTVSATFSKQGYLRETLSGLLVAGQTLDLSAILTPAPVLQLNVTSPLEGAIVHDNPVSIVGTVTNEAQLTINGQPSTVANGVFSGSALLVTGDNTVAISAVDQYAQNAVASLHVNYLPGPAINTVAALPLSATSVKVSWFTDQPATSAVEYGETTAYGFTATDTGQTTQHAITLTGLKPGTTYHYRVASTNGNGFTTTSIDQTFATPLFSAKHLSDSGNVAFIEVEGNYEAKNPDGSINATPRKAIAAEYFKTHPDVDFLVYLTTFDYAMPEPGAQGFYLEAKNDIQGINRAIFDNSAQFGSSGRLQGTIDLGNVTALAANPYGSKLDETVTTLNHELTHRFGAYVRFKNTDGTLNTDLLGKDNAHWSYLLDSKGSIMYGNGWKDNGNGTFTATSARSSYSALDLYLMGMIPKEQVPPMTLIENAAIDKNQLPQLGATITGTAKTVTIDDIIAAEGPRMPDASTSPKRFNVGFVLIQRPGDNTTSALAAIETLRSAWAGRFSELTQGIGGVNGVTPSLSVVIDTPADGATVIGPDVTVTGTVINSTGVETGIVVNGIPGTVTGSRFIANHVPLQEGANTITITATDVNGQTSTATRNLTAAAGNYIRITSNIESGVAPLSVAIRLDGSFGIDNPTIVTTGPVPVTLTPSTSPTEFTAQLGVEGTYTISVSAVGPDNQTYSDTVTVAVVNYEKIDNLLRSRWDGMKTALNNQNVGSAASYFNDTTRNKYTVVFQQLAAYLPEIASSMSAIDLDYVSQDLAEYRISRSELVKGQLQNLTYLIYFVKDKDGLWKIENM